MQRYFDVVQNRQGTAVVGATVTVYDSNGNLASLYSDNSSTPTSNPVYTNADGEYAFYAVNGTYTIQIAATGYTGETKSGVVLFDPSDSSASNDIQFLQAGTGAQVRSVQSKLRDVVSVKDFGATSGADTAEINAAIAYSISSGARVEFPFAATIRVPEDAPTIQAAIDAIYPDPTVGFLLTINLSSGYQIEEGALIENGDYGNIQITSSDATVNVGSSFVGVSGGDSFSTNSLLVVKNATAPRWSIFVDCNNVAGGLVYTTQAKGFIDGSKGVTDSAEYGLYVANQSQVFATNAVFTLSGYGNRVTVNSMLNAPQANFSGTKNEFYVGSNRAANLDVSRGSLVYVTGTPAAPTNLTGGLGRGLAVRRSFVSATHVDCSNVGQDGLNVDLGGVVAFNGSIASNCGLNGVVSAGIVYFNDGGFAIDNANYNLFANNGGFISAREATLTGGGVQGVRAAQASEISIPGANCWRNGVSDQATDIVVSDGSYISAVGAFGGTSSTPLSNNLAGSITKSTENVIIQTDGADVDSTVDFNFSGVSTGSASLRFWRVTNTSGLKRLLFYRGDGTATLDNQIGVDGQSTFFNSGRVAIGTNTPDASAQLTVESTTSGFLPPRMTTTQRNAISSPADGLIIYNTTDAKLQVRAGGVWVDLH